MYIPLIGERGMMKLKIMDKDLYKLKMVSYMVKYKIILDNKIYLSGFVPRDVQIKVISCPVNDKHD